jgi:hypothetical protein
MNSSERIKSIYCGQYYTKFIVLILLLTNYPTTAFALDTPQKAADDIDPASRIILDVNKPNNPKKLRTRVSGNLTSEMYFTQKTRMQPTGPGSYEQKPMTVFPFYQTFRLRADELGIKGLSLHINGVAGLDLANVYFYQRLVADPTYVYLQFKDYGITTRLGRQFVFQGTAKGLKMDGIYISYLTPILIGVETFAGLTVSPLEGPDWYKYPDANPSYADYGRGFTNWNRQDDYVFGGRLFYSMTERIDTGISFTQVTHLGEIDRQLLGVNLNLTPARHLNISGNMDIDLPAAAIREIDTMIDADMGKFITTTINFRRTDPSLFISKTSIFSVFSMNQHDSIGISVLFKLFSKLTIFASYHQLLQSLIQGVHTIMELGHRITTDARFRFGKEKKGIIRMSYNRLAQNMTAVNQFRLSAAVPLFISGLIASANTYLDLYKQEINGHKIGFTGDTGIFYKHDTIATGASITAGSTPFAQSEIKGMLKFAWNYSKLFTK